MVRLLVLTLLATAVTGCGGKSYKVDHPVVGPAPPRIPGLRAVAMGDGEGEARGQSNDVQLVSTGGSSAQPFEMSDVVATVNGKPILVATVFARHRAQVEAIQKQATAAQYRQFQEQTLRELLPAAIEQAMMVSVMEKKLNAEQTKAVNSQIDQLFEKQLEDMRLKMEKGLNRPCSLADLEADIQRQGMTIPVMRKMFGDNAIAEQYMMTKLEKGEPVGRPVLLAAYRERIQEFTEPAVVQWQQIQVSFRNFGDEAEARRHAQAALNELQRGASFSAVAKKYSDGPDAENGGVWDWTQYESLLPEIREPLSTLPPKTPSQLITTSTGLQIVQVIERRNAKTRPFEEVQDKLRQEITETRHKARVKEILDELRSQCVVTTIFDDLDNAGSATPAATQAPAAEIR